MKKKIARWLYNVAVKLNPSLLKCATIRELDARAQTVSAEVCFDPEYLCAIYDNNEQIQNMMQEEAAHRLTKDLGSFCTFEKRVDDAGRVYMRAYILVGKPDIIWHGKGLEW